MSELLRVEGLSAGYFSRLSDPLIDDPRIHHVRYLDLVADPIATALACRPRVLLLDEPVAGVPEGERQEIFDIVGALPADVSVLLIEHDMDLVFRFARSVTVLVDGAIFAEGDAASISADPRVAELAYGKRRLLEIAMALACQPRVLLLDEPVAGVPEGEREEIFDIVNALPAEVSVLLIEHDMDLVFNFARRVTVLVNGAIFAEGDAATVAADPRVMAVYLGEGGHG